MKFRKKHKEESEVFTDSLNDILFILLMFFLIVGTLANPNVRKASLPRAGTNTKSKQTVVVTIDAAGKFYIASKEVDSLLLLETLTPIIDAKKKTGEEISVMINADRRSTLDHFATVLRITDALGVPAVMGVDKKGIN
ncbi:MAG TPA: biopolymer transporter ExbD [Chitinophagaceae bacterium]